MLSCSQRAAALPTGVEERASAPLDSGRRRRSSVVVVEPVRFLVSVSRLCSPPGKARDVCSCRQRYAASARCEHAPADTASLAGRRATA